MTPQKEDYLKTIIQLGGDKELINNKLIGQALNVSPASVTEMSSKLLKDGYIIHIPYQGVKLSEKGLQLASHMIRKHRLWEVFLADHLGFTWDEVHDLAEKLEHVSSDILIDRLEEFLEFPETDPHGAVIPNREGKITSKETHRLQEMKKSETFIILEVDDESSFLKYLSEKNIQLGVRYTMNHIESFEGPLSFLDTEGKAFQLSHKAATKVLVQKQ